MSNRSILTILFCSLFIGFSNLFADTKAFYGMWTIEVDGGGVGWLEVHEKEGFLDANLLWKGGSVLPVGHVYFEDDETLVVTRVWEVAKTDDKENGRKHTITALYRMHMEGDRLVGVASVPNWRTSGLRTEKFTGTKLPAVPKAPDLHQLQFGEPIALFNGKDLSGWKLLNPEHNNGFKVVNGELVNDPIQKEGQHIRYGNIRTEAEFEDFNLKLEVNVPEHNNSGVYLRGMYEIQVFDSYGKDLDSHHMGAVYSRVTPAMSAERPGGEWQALDITLADRHITVKLNGKTIIYNKPVYGPTGGAIIADVFKPGPIYLQGDHGKVSYRNLVLTPIIK